MNRISKFFSELLRRKVVRMVGAYIALFWILAQGYASLYPALGLPGWSLRVFILVGIALVPVLAFLSWRYDVVPPQLVRDVKDVADVNPAIRWAMHRHENTDGSYLVLRWEDSGGRVQERRFFKPVSIGRGLTNSVDLSDERVSRFHAVLWAEAGEWHIRDNDSANGTFIDSVLVVGNVTLPAACELRFHRIGPVVRAFVGKPEATRVDPSV